MIEAIRKCVAGLDVHKKTVMCTILTEKKGGILKKTTREFSTFRDDLNRLAKLLYSYKVELAVMESTGIYWKSRRPGWKKIWQPAARPGNWSFFTSRRMSSKQRDQTMMSGRLFVRLSKNTTPILYSMRMIMELPVLIPSKTVP